MSWLIDTNALSELKKRRPHPGVAAWFAQRPAASLHLSVLTFGELRKGIDAMPEGDRKTTFAAWLEVEVPAYFAGRILGIDAHTADRWGRLCAEARRPLPAIDSLLAATALVHGLTLVTRNLGDFQLPLLRVFNPWGEPPEAD
ncbi:MAG: type II toxin-antitoxin system VapC family toxin [Lamprocystis purpurea]|uniref:type II toxin-antitoxin system VapC family toxin n=1 Tax=Lamprocystis purpurea TaxID=61598 RepID=UPI00036721D0|nr:type II toxin-antitoxin system VapC family toxin [Lamprocystis purpurea]MBV5275491.1 type II toxin-antitoxin system VapC family toxin [Lamprocystis purpurea]